MVPLVEADVQNPSRTFVVIDAPLRGADVFVPRQRLYHPHVDALVGKLG